MNEIIENKLMSYLDNYSNRSNKLLDKENLEGLEMIEKQNGLKLLSYASCSMYLQIKKELLLEKSIDVNVIDIYERNILYYFGGHPEMVDLLLKRGVDVTWIDKEGNHPLFYAKDKLVAERYLEIVSKKGDEFKQKYINCVNKAGERPLIVCPPDVVGVLLKNGVDVNFVDEKGNSVYHLLWSADVLKSLLKREGESGANIESFLKRVNGEGDTPLHACIRRSVAERNEIMQQILSCGIDINIRQGKGGLGMTPLHLAAGNRQYKTVKLMLEKYGANSELEDDKKRTPSHIAGENNDLLMIWILQGKDIGF
ncbi:MAG: ankyrin repeat domain-containing protein [Patescibacteria group bacterium]